MGYENSETWWNSDGDLDLLEINGEIYILNGWNGEEYQQCWKFLDKSVNKKMFTIKPVYMQTDKNGDFIKSGDVEYTVTENL